MANHPPGGISWRIRPIARMQNWPLLVTVIDGFNIDTGEFTFFQIVGTDSAEIMSMAEKVKTTLEGKRHA